MEIIKDRKKFEELKTILKLKLSKDYNIPKDKIIISMKKEED